MRKMNVRMANIIIIINLFSAATATMCALHHGVKKVLMQLYLLGERFYW